jgi:hypothetical protein
MSTMWKNPQSDQNNRPSARGGFVPRGRGRGRGPSRLTNHNPKDPYFYCQYHGRGHSTEGCLETKKNMARIQQEKALMSIASSMLSQFRPNFWQPQFMNSQPSPVPIQQFSQPQSSWQPSQEFFPSHRQSNQSSNHSQFGKSYHHHPTVRQDLNQVQDLRTRRHYRLSGLSCQFQEGQPWNSRLRSKEATTSGL